MASWMVAEDDVDRARRIRGPCRRLDGDRVPGLSPETQQKLLDGEVPGVGRLLPWIARQVDPERAIEQQRDPLPGIE